MYKSNVLFIKLFSESNWMDFQSSHYSFFFRRMFSGRSLSPFRGHFLTPKILEWFPWVEIKDGDLVLSLNSNGIISLNSIMSVVFMRASVFN